MNERSTTAGMLHDNPHHERHRHTHTRTSPCSQAAEHKMEKEKTCGESVVSFLLRARERDGSSLRNRRRAQHAAAALLHHCAKMQVLPRGTHAADVEVTRQSSKRCKQSTNFGAAAERGSVEAATERKYILGVVRAISSCTLLHHLNLPSNMCSGFNPQSQGGEESNAALAANTWSGEEQRKKALQTSFFASCSPIKKSRI